MAHTARRYGLRVDHWVDERLDPQKSTIAAAAYLRDLYRQFGSWFLAQAAYNAGEAKVARAMQLTRSKDFWELARSDHLREETKDFVPAIQAATRIGRDPDRYGFELSLDDAESEELHTVLVPPSTDLRQLSHRAGLSPETLEALNPELWRSVTPPGAQYELKVPLGTRDHVERAAEVESGIEGQTGSRGELVHLVRPGDTVREIARRYGVGIRDIVRWNNLAKPSRIRPGERLQVAPPASELPSEGATSRDGDS
jgi:membrane-bound lytic murein transglycosylase D